MKTRNSSSTDWRVFLFVVAVLFLAVSIRWFRIQEYPFAFGHPDSGQYTDTATRLLRGEAFTPSIIRVNGTYAIFLFTLLKVLGPASLPIVIAQTLLALVAAILGAVVIKRLTHSLFFAGVALLLLTCLPRGFLYEHIILGDTLFASLLLLFTYVAERFVAEAKARWCFLLGLLVAGLVLSRGQGLVGLIVAFPLILVSLYRHRVPLMPALLRLSAFGIPLVALLTLYVQANIRTNNFPGLSAAGSYNLFWIASSRFLDFESPLHADIKEQLKPYVRATNEKYHGWEYWGVEGLESAGRPLAGITFPSDDWKEIDRIHSEIARETIRSHPLAFLYRMLWNASDFLWNKNTLFQTIDLRDLLLIQPPNAPFSIDPGKAQYAKSLNPLASLLPPENLKKGDAEVTAQGKVTDAVLNAFHPLARIRVFTVFACLGLAILWISRNPNRYFGLLLFALAIGQVLLTTFAANALYDRYFISVEPFLILVMIQGLAAWCGFPFAEKVAVPIAAFLPVTFVAALFGLFYLLPIPYPLVDKPILGLNEVFVIEHQRRAVATVLTVAGVAMSLIAYELVRRRIIGKQLSPSVAALGESIRQRISSVGRILSSRSSAFLAVNALAARERIRSISRLRGTGPVILIGLALLLCSSYLWRIVVFDEVPILSSTVNNITDSAPTNLVFGPGSELSRQIVRNRLSWLWSSSRDMGTPILFLEYQMAPLHPWSMLRALLPYVTRWQINAFVLLSLIGLCHLLMGRRIFGFSWYGSILFAEVSAFNPFILRNLNHQYLLAYTSALWSLYFVLSSLSRSHSARQLASLSLALTFCISLSILAGFPEAVFPVACITGCVVLTAFFLVPKRVWLQTLCVGLISALVALLLTSAQVLAFIEGLMNFYVSRDGLGLVSLRPSLISNVFVRFDAFQNRVFFFAGLVPLFLLVLSVRTRVWKHVSAIHGAGLAVAALLFFVHVFRLIPPLHRLIGQLPILSVSNIYGYFPPMFLIGFGWCVAAAIEHLIAQRPDFPRWTKTAVVGVVAMWSLLAWLFVNKALRTLDGQLNPEFLIRVIPGCLFVLVAFPLYVLASRFDAAGSLSNRRRLAQFVVVAVFAEQYLVMQSFRYDSPQQVLDHQFGRDYQTVERVLCNRDDRQYYRLHWSDKILPEFCVANPESMATATPLPRNEALKAALFDRTLVISQPKHSFSLGLPSIEWWAGPPETSALFDRLQIPHTRLETLSSGEELYEIGNSLPRVYTTTGCRTFPGTEAVLTEISNDRYRLGEALIETEDPAIRRFCASFTSSTSAEQPDVARVRIREDSGSKVILDTVRGPTILILNDSFYPGWAAREESSGEALTIRPANVAFRALYLSEERNYDIVFEYCPTWRPLARILTIAGLLIVGGTLFWLTRSLWKDRQNNVH